MNQRSHRAAAACVGLLLGATGLVGAAPPDDATSTAPPPLPNPGPRALAMYALGPAMRPRPTVACDPLSWLGVSRCEYKLVKRGKAGATVAQTMQTVEAGWRRNRLDLVVEHLQLDASGNLVMSESHDLDNELIIRFVKPVVVMPAVLEPGKLVASESRIEIFRQDKPTKRIDHGTCRMTVVYDADQTLAVPAGRFDCRRINMACSARFGMGAMQTETTLYCTPKVGVVAEHYAERGRIFILPHGVKRTIILSQAPDDDASQVAEAPSP